MFQYLTAHLYSKIIERERQNDTSPKFLIHMLFSLLKQYFYKYVLNTGMKPRVCELHTVYEEILQHAYFDSRI